MNRLNISRITSYTVSMLETKFTSLDIITFLSPLRAIHSSGEMKRLKLVMETQASPQHLRWSFSGVKYIIIPMSGQEKGQILLLSQWLPISFFRSLLWLNKVIFLRRLIVIIRIIEGVLRPFEHSAALTTQKILNFSFFGNRVLFLRLVTKIIQFMSKSLNWFDQFLLELGIRILIKHNVLIILQLNSFVLTCDVFNGQLSNAIFKSNKEGSFAKPQDIHFIEDYLLENIADIRSENSQVNVFAVDCDIFCKSIWVMEEKDECWGVFKLAKIVTATCDLVPASENGLFKWQTVSFFVFFHFFNNILVQKNIFKGVAMIFSSNFFQFSLKVSSFFLCVKNSIKTSL